MNSTPDPRARAHVSDQPRVLALDLGTTAGWAVHANARITSGSVCFSPGRMQGPGMRFLKFRHWLTDQKAHAGGFDQVVYEDVRNHTGTDAAHIYGGFLATLQAWCEHHQIPYRGVGVGTIKKFATGKGNADKTAMIEAARAAGYHPTDHNEADAIALLRLTIRRTREG